LKGWRARCSSPVALTIVFALSASLMLSLTVVPVLASFLLKRGDAHEPWLMRKLQAGYAPLLHWPSPAAGWWPAGVSPAGRRRRRLPRLGKTFMPTMDEGDIIMQLEKLPSISLDQTIATDLRVQQAILKAVPEVKAIVARSGSDELGLDPMGLNQTDTFMVLKPREEWRKPTRTG
jgi:cobalt-zinc-cadmium resistance protein CzcA